MLLNASHEITNCGLPQHIQERYVRYKQGNRAIVAWMTKYGPEQLRGKKTLPIKQMVALGRSLCDKAHMIGSLPPDVDHYFNEVIKERTYLSQHYRRHRNQCAEDDVDTVNHEHFTESLKQIHQILLTAGKAASKPTTRKSCSINTRSRSSTNSVADMKKCFSHLLLNEDHVDHIPNGSDDGASSETDNDTTSECSHAQFGSCASACEEGQDITDFLDTAGNLGVAVESIIFLNNIQKIATAIERCWTKAGKGQTPVPAAAAYTNVLLVRAVNHVRGFHENLPDLSSLADLKQRLICPPCTDHDHALPTQKGIDELLDGLNGVHELLLGKQQGCESPSLQLEIINETMTSTKKQETLLQSLVSQIQAEFQKQYNTSITLEGLTCLGELKPFQNGSCDSAKLLTSCTTLWLLAVSHCAYSEALTQPNRIAIPRISALKVAKEAISSIDGFLNDKTIIPCRCINTLGFRVAQMRNDLEEFAKYKCWNTLVQSPHIAGNHILEILDLCSYYGMQLFHYRQYVAAVLHCYQALKQLQCLDSISILEELCDLFVPCLYTTGSRPKSGFMVCWLRYVGARLRFRKGKKDQNHKDTWCMAVPAHAAARSAGLGLGGKNENASLHPKFDYGTIDGTMRLKHEGWSLSAEVADLLDKEFEGNWCTDLKSTDAGSTPNNQPPMPAQKARRTKHKRSKSCHADKSDSNQRNTTCHKLDHVVDASFTPNASEGRNLPPSKINLLYLFRSMTKVVSGISDATHVEDNNDGSSSSKDSGRGQMCLCFVQTILRAADRIQDVRKISGIDAKGATWSKNEKECIECYKEHLMKMLEVPDGSGGFWLWSSI